MESIQQYFRQLNCTEFYDVCVKYFLVPIDNLNHSAKNSKANSNPAEFFVNDILQITASNKQEINLNASQSSQVEQLKSIILKRMKTPNDFFQVFNRAYDIDHYPIFKTAILAQTAINNQLTLDSNKNRPQQSRQHSQSISISSRKSQPNIFIPNSLAKYFTTTKIHIYIYKALISLTLLLHNYQENILNDKEITFLPKSNFAALFYLLKYFNVLITNEDIRQYVASNASSDSSSKKISNTPTNDKIDIHDLFIILSQFLKFFSDNSMRFINYKDRNSPYFNFFMSIMTTVIQMMPQFSLSNHWDFFLIPVSFYFSYFSSKNIIYQQYDMIAQTYFEMCNQIKNILDENSPELVQTKVLFLLSSIINNFDVSNNMMPIESSLKICFDTLSIFPKLQIVKTDNQSTLIFITSLLGFINIIYSKYQAEHDNEKSKSNTVSQNLYQKDEDQKLQYMNPQDYFSSHTIMHFYSIQEVYPSTVVQNLIKFLKNFFNQSNFESSFIFQALSGSFNVLKSSSYNILLSSFSGKFIKICDPVVDFINHLLQLDIYKIDPNQWKQSQIQLNDSILFFLFSIISKNKGILPIFSVISRLNFSILRNLLPMFRSLLMIDEEIKFSRNICQSHIIDMIRFNLTQSVLSNEKTRKIMDEVVGFLQVISVSHPRIAFSELSFVQLLKDLLVVDEYAEILLPCFKTGLLTTDDKCVTNILQNIALIVVQAIEDGNYVSIANRLILILSEIMNSLSKKSLKEYEENHIFELISKLPSASKTRESLVIALKFFLNVCLKFNSYIQMFSDILVYQHLKEAFSYVKFDSEIFKLLLSMTMNSETDLESIEKCAIQNRSALKLLVSVIKDSDEELDLLKGFHKICSLNNFNIYEFYQSGLVSYLLERVDVPELQSDVFSLFQLICTKVCSPMILNKVHSTMISSKSKIKLLSTLLQMMRDDSVLQVSSFFEFSGPRTGIFGPSIDLAYLTTEWSFSTAINIEKVPSAILNLSEGSSNMTFSINQDYLVEFIRTEKKNIFNGEFKQKIEKKKWTFLTFIVTFTDISLYINFDNKETFPLTEKFTYNGPAMIKIAEGFTGEIGRTYFFSTIDINTIKEEVLSNEIIKKHSICSYDPRGAYMGEIIDATSDNRCHLMGTAVPFSSSFRDIIQSDGIYQLFMSYFSIVESEEFFILCIQVLIELINISSENAKYFEKIGGFRLLIGLFSIIDKNFFTIKISEQMLVLFNSLKSEYLHRQMFLSYWMNITFISTLNYDFQIHFYKSEFYNAFYNYKGKITLDFVEALLYEIAKTFDNNSLINEDIKNIRDLQLALLSKIIIDVQSSICKNIFQLQFMLFNKNCEIDIQKQLLNMIMSIENSPTSKNQFDLINYAFPLFLSKDNEIKKIALKLIASLILHSPAQQTGKEVIYNSLMFIKDDDAHLFNECFKIMFLSQQQQEDEKLNILDKSVQINSIIDSLLSNRQCVEMTPILIMLSIFYTKKTDDIVRDKVYDLMYHAFPKLGLFYHNLASPLCLLIFSLNFADDLDRFVEPFVVACFSNIQLINYILPIFNSFSKFSKTDVFKWKLHFCTKLIQRSIQSSLYMKEIATLAAQFMVHRYKPTEKQSEEEQEREQENNNNQVEENNNNQVEENNNQVEENNNQVDDDAYEDVSTRKFTDKDSIDFINYIANSTSSSSLDQAYIYEPYFVQDKQFLESLFDLLYLLMNDKKNAESNASIEIPLSSTMNYSAQKLRKIIATIILKIDPNNEVIKCQLLEVNQPSITTNSNLQNPLSGPLSQSTRKITGSHPLFKFKFKHKYHSKKDILDNQDLQENIDSSENLNSDGADIGSEEMSDESFISIFIKEGEILAQTLLNDLNDWQYLLDIKPIFFSFRTEIIANAFKTYVKYIESKQQKENTKQKATDETKFDSIYESQNKQQETTDETKFESLYESQNKQQEATDETKFESLYESQNKQQLTTKIDNEMNYLAFYSIDILKAYKHFKKYVKRHIFMYQKYNQKLATTYLNESNEKLSDSSKKHWKASSKIDNYGRKLFFTTNRNYSNHIDASKLRDSLTDESNDDQNNSDKKKEEQVVTYKRILDINRSLTKYYKKDQDLSFEVMMVTVIGKYQGNLIVTNKMLLFEGTLKYESFDNQADESKTNKKHNEKQKFVSILLRQILFIFNRWSMHIDNSCEVYSLLRKSFFFIFPDNQTRTKFYNKIDEIIGKSYKTFKSSYFFSDCCHICNGVCQKNTSNTELILKSNLIKDWQTRRLSNFQYIFFLNIVSGRSFNDLSQYPVYPWILKDYQSEKIDLNDEKIYRDLSVPIAAMNEERLNECNQHYLEMDDPLEKCQYRSHYSSPALIIGFMIRLEPFTSLHIDLQSGRFDCPDRLFYSIEKSWNGVTSTSNDYKELIPEFFTFPQIFINENKLDLGKIQGHDYRISDVILPKWASNAYEFIEIHQRALESEYVRCHLNEWIDLIFGCYQKSFEKRTMYHPFSYHDCMKLPEVQSDPANQQLAQYHSANFGCCPDKLFVSCSPKTTFSIPKQASFVFASSITQQNMNNNALASSPSASAQSTQNTQISLTNTNSSSLSTSQVGVGSNLNLINNSMSSSMLQIPSLSFNFEAAQSQINTNQNLCNAFNNSENIIFCGSGIILLKNGCVFSTTKNFSQVYKISMQIQPNYKNVLYFNNHYTFVFLQRNGGFASCLTVQNQQNQAKEILNTISHKSSNIECLCMFGKSVLVTGGSDCCINAWKVPDFTLTASIPIQSGVIVALGADPLLESIVAIDSQNLVYLLSINPVKHVLTFPLNLPENVNKHKILLVRSGLIVVASDSADRKNVLVSFFDLRGFLIKKLEFEGTVEKFFTMYPSYAENFVVILTAQSRRLIVIDLATFDVASQFKGSTFNNCIWPFEDRRAILYLKNGPKKEISVFEF